MAVANVIAGAAPQLADLGARLAADGGTFLDVGCGTAWLSIALARRFPALTVTGLDIWPPALALAERNVQASQLAPRVRLRRQDVTVLDEARAYDAIWLPGPFLPHDVCLRALPRVVQALRPGGWLLFGLFGGPPDPLLNSLADLRAVRAGGHAWAIPELVDALRGAKLLDVKLVAHGTPAPLRLVVGRTAG